MVRQLVQATHTDAVAVEGGVVEFAVMLSWAVT